MGLIKYDGKTIIDAKNNIDVCHGNILESIEKIHNELTNMGSTMSTPKSNKTIETYTDYFNKKIEYMKNSKENYNKMLDDINNEYMNYLNIVNEMVGGNND